MGRQSGGVRPVSKGSKAYNRRRLEYAFLMATGKYSEGYFSTTGGGYYVVENMGKPHTKEETKAAQHLADAGYIVTLKNESSTIHKRRMAEGRIFKASFEQKTPDSTSVKRCLDHARFKRASIAVIYDKYGIYHRRDIYAGIQEYEDINSSWRFYRILVIDSKGKVHIHKHGERP